jgi:plasmid maintenance system killer protein
VPQCAAAWRKLALLDAAEVLADLRMPPGNRLEKLAGDRAGQYGNALLQDLNCEAHVRETGTYLVR